MPEVREWEEINLASFTSTDEKYVVCLDTMGQDRELTDDEKRFALRTVERYIDIWEENVRKSLEADRDKRLAATKVEVDADAEAELAQ